MKKYSELSHSHFQNRIWRNELEMMQKETDFFLTVVQEIDTLDNKELNNRQEWFINQFHHFERLIKQLSTELTDIEKGLAVGVQEDNILDKEQRLDQSYFRERMDYFEQDYRSVKARFRAFIANSDTEGID
ncbi:MULTISPECIES: hypothetical protein [Emticicia]|uniref:hypothetical protein n=1 Tax=Emticicia TaxID=312278 RepID=UPI0020A1AFFD|nr:MULTISPECIES: hypothetical protein [Emticicia]UTA67142.1 hypothetical protein MB380_16230 [Emticicia sp. 21SJ11W-3]